MMMEEKAHKLAKLNSKPLFRTGTSRKWITKAYTKIEMSAQVSLGSQAQYLPQLSLAQTPPKNVPTVNKNKPIVMDSSFTIFNSCRLTHHCEVGLAGLKIINTKLNKASTAASANGA